MYLFDTDVLSAVMKYPPAALLMKLASVKPEDQFTSAMVIGELAFGAYRTDRAEYFLGRLDRLLQNVRVLPIDQKVADSYGKLRAALERARTPLDDPDMLIAATALAGKLTVVTGNVRHFHKVPGLNVENWLR